MAQKKPKVSDDGRHVKRLLVKIFAITLSLLMVITFYLFFAQKIGVYVFWGIVIVCAISAYWMIPCFMKRLNAER